MAPNVTGYDITIQVRDAGEVTTAEGWIERDGGRHHLRVEASATDRGATYYLDGEPRCWSEVEWLDQWFEDLWMETATDAGYDLGNEIDFDARMRSKEAFPDTRVMGRAGAHTVRRILRFIREPESREPARVRHAVSTGVQQPAPRSHTEGATGR